MSALWAVALIMLFSGSAKLRSREDVGAVFARLKVPRPLAAPWLAAAFPWLELLLGVALLQPFTVLRPLVAAVAVALFIAFLALVVRARGDGVSCGCFGEASAAPISGQTVLRNVLFLVLAVMALVEGVVSLGVHGPAVDWLPLSGFGGGAWAWALVVALVGAASAFLVGRESVPAADGVASAGTLDAASPASASATASAADGEPERRPIPAAVVVQDGHFTTLRHLVMPGAVVALRLSPGCGSCQSVVERLPELTAALGPVRARVLMPRFGLGDDQPVFLGSIPADLAMDDPGGAAATSLGLTSFPSAVLLGADGLTAGGPVFGADEVIAFLEEIAEIMAVELPQAQEAARAEQDGDAEQEARA